MRLTSAFVKYITPSTPPDQALESRGDGKAAHRRAPPLEVEAPGGHRILARPRDPDQAHGLARRCTPRPGDAGDGDRARGPAFVERAARHLAGDLLAHGAEALERRD